MEEAAEKIVIYAAYDTVMQANLVKTKLDAYGIPCFLTEENFTGLYPLRNDIFLGVRLHVFEKDFDRVKEVLTDSPLVTDPILCPRCNSVHVTLEARENGKKGNFISILTSLVSIPRKVYYCHDCRHEWD